MKTVIAIDSFKGSLSSLKAGEAISEGIKEVYKDALVKVCPIADGGEGTSYAMTLAMGGEMVTAKVHGPLGDIIESSYGYVEKEKLAIIEMSAASGITLIKEKQRNPLNTTTFGVGELILDAVKKGCRRFIVGIGGSATNDGGVGMLQALGFEFLDENNNQVEFGAKGLEKIKDIKADKVQKELKECEFLVACDVKNVLCGENGCSKVYGPQKGATPEMIEDMDLWLKNYAELTKKVFPTSDDKMEGAGAAGGLGFAFCSYLGAKLKSGIELVLKEIKLEEEIKNADFVITGEGRLDGQSYMGKAPVGVASLAKKYGTDYDFHRY